MLQASAQLGNMFDANSCELCPLFFHGPCPSFLWIPIPIRILCNFIPANAPYRNSAVGKALKALAYNTGAY